MAKKTKSSDAKPTTADVVEAVKNVQDMSGKRARFILIALLTGEQIPLKAFRRAEKMASHPTPIETATAADYVSADLIR